MRHDGYRRSFGTKPLQAIDQRPAQQGGDAGMADCLRHGTGPVAAFQCRHQVVEMQCALEACTPLRQRGIELRVVVAGHNG